MARTLFTQVVTLPGARPEALVVAQPPSPPLLCHGNLGHAGQYDMAPPDWPGWPRSHTAGGSAADGQQVSLLQVSSHACAPTDDSGHP